MRNLARQLKEDLEQELLTIFYQPIIDCYTQKIVSAEALIRWNHRTLGNIPAAEVIKIAETWELIVPLGEWVLTKTCMQVNRWHAQGLRITAAVNVSPMQLEDLQYTDKVYKALRQANIEPGDLVLEITETENLFHYGNAFAALRELSDFGVKLSIDDFGVGYASVGYLTQMHCQYIKIDRSFVRDIQSRTSREIIKSILSLAKQLNISVIVEGVEDESEKEILQQIDCRLMQGYLFGKPMELEQFNRNYIRGGVLHDN
ncbi:EAL domain-containing protein [Paenibacillus thermotolerans]|uniref:EAL domain-containing protein n=1 Tax=Paenibacillus thermotolerans TaxID=3027807 RepID=UPI0023687B88|nr:MULTISPECIES: EAL domain-containing protein [unclassified Paenibacillus]